MNFEPPEFSRCYALNIIGGVAQNVTIIAGMDERAALAKRFELAAIDHLAATATLVSNDAGITATGRLTASVIQNCAATDAPVAATVDEPFAIRFVGVDDDVAGEIEIDSDDCDITQHDGAVIDLGEAVAQSLALALDPFPRSKDAAERLKQAGVTSEDEVVSGAFAGLKGLLSAAPKAR